MNQCYQDEKPLLEKGSIYCAEWERADPKIFSKQNLSLINHKTVKKSLR